ncbi:AIR synthase [Weeksellaceae bacterium TAE3-ERU29]|nr:AIR synthase [Weeksellaceae bacterium TAE3-ERU29]
MKSGKISAEGFKQMFQSRFGFERKNELITPGFGKDISLIDLGNGKAMVTASDPLSFIPKLGAKKSAELSVYLISNDMATTGVMPQYFQMVLNLNENFTEQDFEDYWEHIHLVCKELKISITGGHTGIIPGQNSTIAGGGTMISIAGKNDFIRCDEVKDNDILLMSKKAGISSTAILGLHFNETAKQMIGENSETYFEDLFSQISVYQEGKLAGEFNQKEKTKPIHAMHDVTEGGILGAIYEMCEANHAGIIIEEDLIPVDEEQKLLCEKFQLNPLEIIGAGSMLMAVEEKSVEKIIQFYRENDVKLTAIGRFSKNDLERKIKSKNQERELIFNEKDPYWDAFFKAFSENWK